MTVTAAPSRSSAALQSTVVSSAGVVIAFVAAVLFLHSLTSHSRLGGVDAALGVPSTAVSLMFFSVFVAASVSRLAGAVYPRPWVVGFAVVTAIGTVYQLIVVVATPSWFAVALAVLAIAVLVLALRATRPTASTSTVSDPNARRIALGVLLVIAGIAGLTAAINLTFDDVNLSITGLKQSCDFSPFAQCSKNLGSWEGSLFGFPNPLIGLGAFTVPLLIGIAMLLDVALPRWFWIAFNACVFLAIVFVGFLIYTSIYVIGTLCVWCALVWAVTIPMFWAVSLRNLMDGSIRVGPRATRFFASAYTWVPIITLLSYVLVAVLFQVHLNVLQYL